MSSAPSPSQFSGVRSAKSLDLAREFNLYQRSWFAEVQASAAAGDPIAVVNADAPQEIFRALDIRYVVTQWWSSVVAAKQKAGAYLGHLEALGYPDTRERYTALAFGSSLDEHRDGAPWGGLPTPAILHAVAGGDGMAKLFEAWAEHTGADLYLIERSTSWREEITPDWWAHSHDRWDELIEPDRLQLMVDELKGLIRFLEQRTGRRWDEARFRAVLDLVNETGTALSGDPRHDRHGAPGAGLDRRHDARHDGAAVAPRHDVGARRGRPAARRGPGTDR